MGIITQLKPTYLIAGGLTAIILCLGLILRSSIVSADDIIDNVAITVESSCSMSGNINTAHTANLKNSTYSGAEGSTYANGIGKTTLTAFCNDQNGFSIYAVGYTGNIAGNTDLVGANNGSFIPTGTAISGDTSNWAMKVTKVENPGGQQPDVTYNPQNMTITNSFNNFHAVPDTYTKVAEYHAETGSSATDQGPGALGAKLETTYATYVSADQYADTYTGQVKYVMVHPYDHATPTDTLIMQDVSTWGSTVTIGQEVTAMDSRDNKTYTVARLADGNLWMTQNLSIIGTVTAALSNFTGNDFNISAGSLASGDNSYSEPRSIYNNNTTYGAYYNYCAASAGTVCDNTSQQDASADICPAGWRLPTRNEMQIIADNSGANWNSALAGEYYDGTLYVAGIHGYWWSSTAYSIEEQYVLNNFNDEYDCWQFLATFKGIGNSIRCVWSP